MKWNISESMNASLGKIVTPIKIDISTDDAIIPGAIEYKLMLDDSNINLLSYNLETILAEKLQTVMSRGEINTRMRDLYDIRTLLSVCGNQINDADLKKAFKATCEKRGTGKLKESGDSILSVIRMNESLMNLWNTYQRKYSYATGIQYDDVIHSIEELWKRIR